MTDNVQGKVTSYIDYDAWGMPLKKNVLKLDARELDMAIEYTGHPYDSVLGIYYARARMYDAADRRFMAPDPIKGTITNPQSLVLYVYCIDNPVKYVDPFGMNGVDVLRKYRMIEQWDKENSYPTGLFVLRDFIRVQIWLAELGLMNPKENTVDRPTYAPGAKTLTPTTGWRDFDELFQNAFTDAIKKFQVQEGLNDSGLLNKETWYKLRLKYFEKLICEDLLFIKLQMPVGGEWNYTSSFGMRGSGFHSGSDFGYNGDRNIYAAHSGKLIVKRSRQEYDDAIRDGTPINKVSQGVYLEITSFDNRVMTRYAHLDSILITSGSNVQSGQRIAIMGSTGRSSGTHLHFDLYVDNVNRNPWEFLA
jgi:RHS repeat-associated protein